MSSHLLQIFVSILIDSFLFKKQWLHGFKRAGIFDSWLDFNTSDRNFIAIHGADITHPWEDTIYKGICDPDVEAEKLGCRKYWELYGQKKGLGGGGGVKRPAPPVSHGGDDLLGIEGNPRFRLSNGPWSL